MNARSAGSDGPSRRGTRASPGRRLTRLVLASGSPRRLALLRPLVADIVVIKSTLAEPPVPPGTDPRSVALVRAREKGAEVARAAPFFPVLAADTVVAAENLVLGQPADAAEAREMLAFLSGRSHTVLTALAFFESAFEEGATAVESTTVRFAPLTARDIDEYVASGEPFDKAGGYGIQGLAALFVAGIEGCYGNVVGLPLHRLSLLLESRGYRLFPAVRPPRFR